MGRRIETAGGTILGIVDRVKREVVWHLECPDCGEPIIFTKAAFQGDAPMRCPCGWNSRPLGHKERSENGSVYSYFNFAAEAFGDNQTGASSEAGGIHSEMRL